MWFNYCNMLPARGSSPKKGSCLHFQHPGKSRHCTKVKTYSLKSEEMIEKLKLLQTPKYPGKSQSFRRIRCTNSSYSIFMLAEFIFEMILLLQMTTVVINYFSIWHNAWYIALAPFKLRISKYLANAICSHSTCEVGVFSIHFINEHIEAQQG